MMQMDATTTSYWLWLWLLASLLGEFRLHAEITTDYCEICKDHIACNNSGEFAKSCPPDVKLVPFDEEDQQHFINMHNKIRSKWAESQGFVKVRACRMSQIKWDDELADLAKLQVKTCSGIYDKCHDTKQYSNSGQNMFYIGYWPVNPSPVDILLQALETWDNMGFWANTQQLVHFKRAGQKSPFHLFALLVVEENVAVGCAAITFAEDSLISYRVTCNYATNNYENYPVFRVCQVTGAKCATGVSSIYTGLCSSSEMFDLSQYPRLRHRWAS